MAELDTFPTTRWSLVGRLGDSGHQEHLAEFLARYRSALVAFIASQPGVKPQEAEDLVQGFVADRIIRSELLTEADAARGRLRNFLMRSLRNYAMNVARSEGAAMRQPTGGLVSLDDLPHEVKGQASAEARFDVEWARSLLSQAIDRTRVEAEAKGKPECWQILLLRVIQPALDQSKPPSYSELVEQLGFKSHAEASNRLISTKRMFARNLRAVISEYIQNPDDVEEELRELRSVLAGSGSAG